MPTRESSAFKFIADDDLRASLEADYTELTKAVDNGLWKCAHVLAGSIIEAVLIDYLLVVKHKNLSEDEILKFDLGKAIPASKEEGILTDDSVALCTVVRQYRNLIHPGRIKRLSVEVDEQRAKVAFSLVQMVVKEVESRRKDAYGITAEQIIGKLLIDPDTAVLESLLRDMKPQELERLAIGLLPKKLLNDGIHTQGQGKWHETRLAYGRCFRLALQVAPELVTKAVDVYLDLIRAGARSDIEIADRYLVTFDILNGATPEQFLILKPHILAIIPTFCETGAAAKWAIGIGKRLTADDVRNDVPSWIHRLNVPANNGKDGGIDPDDLRWLAAEFCEMDEHAKGALVDVVNEAQKEAIGRNRALRANGLTMLLRDFGNVLGRNVIEDQSGEIPISLACWSSRMTAATWDRKQRQPRVAASNLFSRIQSSK